LFASRIEAGFPSPADDLMPENKKFKPYRINDEDDVLIWGVVTNVIHKID